MSRLSRPCYDKIRRCPGWIGGGPKYPRGASRCDNGWIQVDYGARLWKWRFWRCGTCDVVIWPYAICWFSVFEWAHSARRAAREVAYRWRTR